MERIIEEEMDGIGGQKLMLPMLLQSDHWKETGRWDTSKGEVKVRNGTK
jgi:prolyl-tRNA synthetase